MWVNNWLNLPEANQECVHLIDVIKVQYITVHRPKFRQTNQLVIKLPWRQQAN